ncbi:MAG TPA: twin-arginine translocation signal domain-containing protein [Deltaproteobacteria bacterium]|nr:twin-arginine translocation signal domain-containing protein [Deltaproteobacteria bacterium]
MAKEPISRRRFLKRSFWAGAGIGGAALAGGGVYKLLQVRDIEELIGAYPEGAERHTLEIMDGAAPRPNVVLIYCDDLGYGDVGCFGNTVIRTPRIDSLAEEGTRFTEYYACNAVCAPSRAGLLTGRYPLRTGIIGNTYPENEPVGRRMARNLGVMLKHLGVLDIREEYVARGIDAAEITLAEALKVAGYRTGMMGKWHLGDYSTNPDFNPLRHGFDYYFGVPYSNDMRPLPLYRNETNLEADLGPGENQAKLTGLYTREAVKFIEDSTKDPFFLYLAHTFPHQPLFPSERFEKRSHAGKFGDVVEEIDWSVGEILTCLEKNDLAENTLVIFTSDNGPWYEGSTGSLRGRKGQSYEGGFRVPFVARWPERIPRGIDNAAPVMNIDLYPTLLSLAGVCLPRDRIVDGKDITALLTGTSARSPHDALYFFHYDQLEGIRAGSWKYFDKLNRYTWPIALDAAAVPNKLGADQLGNRWPLLYDVNRDPGESYNVINTYPDVAEKLKKKMDLFRNGIRSNPRGFK